MKILYFGACWCPSCLVMRTIFNKIIKEYSNITFIEYDYDLDEESVNKYQVNDFLPEVILIDNNDFEVIRIIGEKNINEIREIIDQFVEGKI